MSEKRKIALFTIINLMLVNTFILGYLNLRYPMVGHDYNLTVSSVLDSALHFRLNGLTIQWFTPSFGGGIPAYPNPENWQFSLTTLLMIFLPPWPAIMLTVIIYTSLGFIACEYLLRHILNVQWTASILGAVFFTANGFVINRVVVGHLGFITFPLLPLFLITLLDRAIPIKYASMIFGLVIAVLMHFTSFFILIIFALSILVTLPILYIYNALLLDHKRILGVLTLGGAIGGLISISKLIAVYSFMRFFPRTIGDVYDTPVYVALFGILVQMLGTMNLVPLFMIAGLKPDALPYFMPAEKNFSFGLWETDMSLSPIVFIILVIGLIRFLHTSKSYTPSLFEGKKKLAWICLLVALWLSTEFILARGLIYPHLKNLPILSSLHVNVRFAAALIFPLILTATFFYNEWAVRVPSAKSTSMFLIGNITTLLFLGTYFLFEGDPMWRLYDASTAEQIYEKILMHKPLEVTEIGFTKNNSVALLTGVSNLDFFEPVFGYHLENFHPQIKPGSIWQLSGGNYNMTNPTGYVYPELNHNEPFARFQAKDEATMELFAQHIQPTWHIPLYQHVLDWVSGLSFLIALGYLIIQGMRLRQRSIHSS